MNQAVLRFSLSLLLILAFFSPNAFCDLSINNSQKPSIDQHINGLVDMAVDGKNENFIEYVKSNDLIDQPDKDGHTPVFAAMFGPPGLVNDVLDLGASIEYRDNLGYTPLISASLLGYPQAVELLISKGADVNARNEDGQTAIMVSVLGLSANQVDMNASGDNQWHNRWANVVDILLQNGADTGVKNKMRDTA